MNPFDFKTVFSNIIKNSLLRHILFIVLGTAVFFPAYSFYFIFPQFASQLTRYTEDAAIRAAEHLKETIFSRGTTLTKDSFARDVEKEILAVMQNLRMEQINIFSESGEVLFSSKPEHVGETNTHEYFLTRVAAGQLYSKVVQKNSKTLEGRTVDAEVVETYVPLMSEGKFKGAVEIYYDITKDRESLTDVLDRLKTAMLIFSVIFVLVLFLMLVKASRNILARERAESLLQLAHAGLEKKVVERTKDLEKTNQSLTDEIENHRKSALALHETEIRLNAILEANPDPMIMYDLKGHPLYINPAFTALFGWSLEDLKGRTIPFVPEDQKQLTSDKIKQILECGKALAFETKRLTKNSRIIDVLISAAVTRGMNETQAGMVVNLTDISEKKALEAQYKQSQKLESIGTLAGGIAHDFNNILAGILGYSQLARMNINHPEKASDNINQIIKGGQRAAELVRQILTFSRQSENEKRSLKVYILLKEVLKLLRSSIPSTIEIKENILSRDAVIADPIQIHQVIMNLCTNAYQAMHETGGRLTVGLKTIQVPGPDNILELNMLPGDYLRLEVSDTGCGIEPDIMDKIFDPYFTTKPSDKGTGLGLSVVHGIVKEHKGFLKVYSRPGQGTVFYVFLPVSGEKETSDHLTDANASLIRGTEYIVIVDDEKDIRTSYAEFFKRQGYKTASFANGQEAWQAFEKNPLAIDFIVTDMTMPKMAGDQLARQVLEIRPDLPVILCSGYSETVSQDAMMKLGIYKFVEKPVHLEKLARMIRDKLDRPAKENNRIQV